LDEGNKATTLLANEGGGKCQEGARLTGWLTRSETRADSASEQGGNSGKNVHPTIQKRFPLSYWGKGVGPNKKSSL